MTPPQPRDPAERAGAGKRELSRGVFLATVAALALAAYATSCAVRATSAGAPVVVRSGPRTPR
jgi:hypothetical protein